MQADNLTPAIWNAIADQIGRTAQQHEIVFSTVTKTDPTRRLIWTEDYGDMALPLVGFMTTFAYYDTQGDGSVKWCGDNTQTNTAFQTQIVMPKVGDVAVVLDLAGARTYPICIGISLSEYGFWETD
jgi:hypothetical protein